MYNITDFDRHLFHEGKHFEAYKILGAHVCEEGTIFTVWAPNAKNISVIGSFNGWNTDANPMKKLSIEGLWNVFIEGVQEYEIYKYHIVTKDGLVLHKSDPVAFYAEVRPKTASVTYNLNGYQWSDSKWMTKRKKWDFTKEPISIY